MNKEWIGCLKRVAKNFDSVVLMRRGSLMPLEVGKKICIEKGKQRKRNL